MNLNWLKCEGDTWCPLLTVNLAHPHFVALEGVYIIWHGGQVPATVYVGQGNIADRLRAHRSESNILEYSSFGLFVTWAAVDRRFHDGVERFLGDKLGPKVSLYFPQAAPIAVNLPW